MFIFLILAIGAVALFLWWFRSGNVSGRSNFLQQNEDSSLEKLFPHVETKTFYGRIAYLITGIAGNRHMWNNKAKKGGLKK